MMIMTDEDRRNWYQLVETVRAGPAPWRDEALDIHITHWLEDAILAADAALAAAEQRAEDAEAKLAPLGQKLTIAEMRAVKAERRAEAAGAALAQAREELAALRRVAEAGQAFLAQLHTGLPLNMATCDLPGYMDFAHTLDVAGMAAHDAAGEVGDAGDAGL